MQYTHTIKDERGKIEITITLATFSYRLTDNNGNQYRYDIRISHTPKGKKKPIYSNTNPIVADAEILEVKTLLWESIKPN